MHTYLHHIKKVEVTYENVLNIYIKNKKEVTKKGKKEGCGFNYQFLIFLYSVSMFPFPDLCFLPLFCLRPATAVVRVRLQKSDIRFVSLTCDWSRQTLTAGEAVLESGWMQTRRKLLLTVAFGNGKIGIAQNNFILKEMEFRTTDETIKLSNCLKL